MAGQYGQVVGKGKEGSAREVGLVLIRAAAVGQVELDATVFGPASGVVRGDRLLVAVGLALETTFLDAVFDQPLADADDAALGQILVVGLAGFAELDRALSVGVAFDAQALDVRRRFERISDGESAPYYWPFR
jgi:hypothetical protein